MIINPILPLLIVVPLLLAILGYLIFQSRKDLKGHLSSLIVKIVIILLVFLINLRPMFPGEGGKALSTNLDVLFVVDTTISMVAEDYNGSNTRLSGVKSDLTYLTDELSGARFSLITFNNSARVSVPYTRDEDMIKESIDILTPIDELGAKGSSLNTPLDTILDSLKSSEKKGDRTRILFFVSDGEITNGDSLKSFSELKSYLSGGAILGYGTTSGGKMKDNSKYGSGDYIMDYSDTSSSSFGGVAISKIDENNLKQISSDTGLTYIHAEKQSDLKSVVSSVKGVASSNLEDSEKKNYTDIYYFFVIPLFILLLFEFNKVRRKTV